MQTPSFIGYVWCITAAVFSAAATYLIKMSGYAGAGLTLARLLWLGCACGSYAIGFVCYSFALQKMHVSLAYPVMTGVTMALVTLTAYLVFQEPLGAGRLAGIALIAAGTFLLAS